MRVVVARDRAALDGLGADWIAKRARPGTCAMLAAGRSVEGVYAELSTRGRPLVGMEGVTLDELHPLSRDDSRTFGAFVDRTLRGTGLSLERFDPQSPDPDGEATRVDHWVRARQPTIGVLGLGPNGHIAFNEPGEALTAPSRRVTLRSSSIRHLGGRRAIAPATGAMTLGLSTLFSARQILLVVVGAKERALARCILGSVGPHAPASLLRMHPDTTVLCTEDELRGIPAAYRQLVGITIEHGTT